jgi:HTH domain in Mos1 transposase
VCNILDPEITMVMEMNKNRFRCIVLNEFELRHNATIAGKNICNAMNRDAIKLRKSQMWLKKIRSENFDLENLSRSSRPKVTEKSNC